MEKKYFQLDLKEYENKCIKNILSNKNKGIIYKLEWNTPFEFKYLNSLSRIFNNNISLKK
jgi:hypothetical protein